MRAFKEAHRVLKNDEYLVLGLVLSDSPWADLYKEKAKRGHPIYSHAKFYSFGELSSILAQVSFRVERVCATLFEEPQDQEPVKNQEIREGFWREGSHVYTILQINIQSLTAYSKDVFFVPLPSPNWIII